MRWVDVLRYLSRRRQPGLVRPDWFARTGAIGDFEGQMLDVTEADRQPTSRLSCQIGMTAELDGIRLLVPLA